MAAAALAMSPGISRMEPVGRKLVPASEAPPPKPQPKPKPKLTDPLPEPPKPAAAPAPDAGFSGRQRRYTVLVGSFAKLENAERVRERFEAKGLEVSVSEATVNHKLVYRVTSGTFEDHGAAEAYGRELIQRDLVDTTYIKPM